MTVLFELFAVLLVARLFGEALHRLGQPASVGEIMAGMAAAAVIAAGGDAIPILGGLPESPILAQAAEVAVFTLLLLAGIEMQPNEIVKGSTRSVLIGLGGVAVPLAGGIALGWALLPAGPDRMAQALLVGVALSITAVPVTIRVLEDLGIVHTAAARTILAAAIVDDVLGLVLLAVLMAVIETGAPPEPGALALLLGKVALFFAATVGFGRHVYPHIRRGVKLMQAMSVELSALVLVALLYGALAELLALHWILGAFMAGMFFEPAQVGRRVYREVRLAVLSIASGIMGPIFFFSIGLALDVSAFGAAPGLILALTTAAFATKLVGAGGPALLLGLGRRDAALIGTGMCARGAVELIVLSIAQGSGLLTPAPGADGPVRYLYSAIVVAALATTIATPVLLRLLISGRRGAPD